MSSQVTIQLQGSWRRIPGFWGSATFANLGFYPWKSPRKTWINPLKGSLTTPRSWGLISMTIWWSFLLLLTQWRILQEGAGNLSNSKTGIHCYWTSRSPCTSPPPTVSWVLHWIEVCCGKQTGIIKWPRFFGDQTWCKWLVILEWFPFSCWCIFWVGNILYCVWKTRGAHLVWYFNLFF